LREFVDSLETNRATLHRLEGICMYGKRLLKTSEQSSLYEDVQCLLSVY